MKICLNGILVAHEDARIDPADRGFTLGDGLFETIAFKRGKPRRLEAHLARLRASADFLGIPVGDSDARIATLIEQTAAANDLINAAVRLTLTRGPGPRGVVPPADPQPTLLITAAAYVEPAPARVIIANMARRNEFSALSRIKSLNYLENIIARREAEAAGADDAILLGIQGRVAESTIANIFLLTGGSLVTPPIEDGALPGIMRAEVIHLAHAEERSIEPDVLEQASEIFLSNALGIRPVTHVDNKPVGDGTPGLITQMLAARL